MKKYKFIGSVEDLIKEGFFTGFFGVAYHTKYNIKIQYYKNDKEVDIKYVEKNYNKAPMIIQPLIDKGLVIEI